MASTTLKHWVINRSTTPPANPAIIPTPHPATSATPMATKPTISADREPNTSRDNTSRPISSVPSRWRPLGSAATWSSAAAWSGHPG